MCTEKINKNKKTCTYIQIRIDQTRTAQFKREKKERNIRATYQHSMHARTRTSWALNGPCPRPSSLSEMTAPHRARASEQIPAVQRSPRSRLRRDLILQIAMGSAHIYLIMPALQAATTACQRRQHSPKLFSDE
jgi:hypothetical protein